MSYVPDKLVSPDRTCKKLITRERNRCALFNFYVCTHSSFTHENVQLTVPPCMCKEKKNLTWSFCGQNNVLPTVHLLQSGQSICLFKTCGLVCKINPNLRLKSDRISISLAGPINIC